MLKTLLYLHIIGGSAALLSMFIPMVTPKGGTTHRRAGWVFVSGMTLVSITALALSAARYFLDPRPQAKAFALFLFFVAVLTGNAVSVGVRVLRTKKRSGPHTHPWDVGLASILTLASMAMAVYGVITSQPLFAAFSVLGFVTGIQGLYYWLRRPTDRMHWWLRHMSAMLGACIAATTAFLVVNAPAAGFSRTSIIVWLAPTVVGMPATAIWTGYYKRRLASSGKAQSSMLNAQSSINAQFPMLKSQEHSMLKNFNG